MINTLFIIATIVNVIAFFTRDEAQRMSAMVMQVFAVALLLFYNIVLILAAAYMGNTYAG